MAQVTFTNGITSLWGAIDSVKDGKRNGYRVVVRDPELRPLWEAAYADYKSSLPEGEPAYHFYNFVFVTIYRDLRLRG